MEIRTVLVIGTGTMGRGIAQACAQSGYDVLVHDASKEAVDGAMERIRESVRKRTARGEWDAAREAGILSRIRAADLSAETLRSADLVVEAIPEDPRQKRALFKELDAGVREDVVLGSNTSSIPITFLAAATKRPERVVGIHFMNPVPAMKGVEIVQGRMTSPATMETARAFVGSLGKIGIIAKDYAGFITSRVLNVYLNEAAYSVMDGNDPSDVDNAALHCFNMPMGPCRLMDMIGIDVVVRILDLLREEFGDRFRCAPLLRQMARAGHYGIKSGRGFYAYDRGPKG